MIKNKPNFVTKKYDLQPEFYVDYFGRVTAVFKHPVNGRNLLLLINAHSFGYNIMLADKGSLVLQYQGEKSHHILSDEIQTLNAAMKKVKKLIDNPKYGDTFEDPALPIDRINAPKWPNKVLADREAEAYRQKCKYFKPKTPFILTEDDKETLLTYGYIESDLPKIEKCANKSVYLLDYNTAIPLEKVLELLDREEFLAGIGRSCFHFSTSKRTKDGLHKIFFESGHNSPYRKNNGL